MSAKRIAIIAGEASGDLLGAGLIEALRKRYPNLMVEGICGPRMQAQGGNSLYPMERLSVMGLCETLGRLAELIPVRRRLIRHLIDTRPDVFIGIDAPDFNLTVASALKSAGIKTAHYVSPSVWAWRRYRIKKIARSLDLMMVLFPFETRFYAEHGMPVEFVGHPLADSIGEHADRANARAELGLDADVPVVALLPGSRQTEIRLLGQTLIETVRWLLDRRPDIRFVTPLVNAVVRAQFESLLETSGCQHAVLTTDSGATAAMIASNVVLLASGTATLEAMLLKRPMVVTYKINPLTYALVHRVIASNISFVGLPNLLAGRELVPELLQDEAVPERLGPAVLDFLDQPARVDALESEFQRLHDELRQNASESAAHAVSTLLGDGP